MIRFTRLISPETSLMILAAAFVALSGCASSSTVSMDKTRTVPDAHRVEPVLHDDSHTRLVMSMSGWLDTPYAYGGTLKSGVDCSAYVQALTSKAFNVQLPRTTVQQMKSGREVSSAALQPGDLVFFKTGRNQYHVGIYLENGEFTHASTSSGVTVSHLNDYYWRDKYLTARRVLEDSHSFESPTTDRVAARVPAPEQQARPSGADAETRNERVKPRVEERRPATGRQSGTWTATGKTDNSKKSGRTGW